MPSQSTHILPKLLYGILGNPLAQSLSPLLHNYGFSRVGHTGVYLAWEKRAEELSAFFAAVRTLPISGLSVTTPHKEAVIPFLDSLTQTATKIGAVNTVYWQDGRLIGHNTDCAGFMAPLLPCAPGEQAATASQCVPQERSALVLGAGGAARAVILGLLELGFSHISLCARTIEKAHALAHAFSSAVVASKTYGAESSPRISVHAWEDRELAAHGMNGRDCIINTTPLGMFGKYSGQSPLDERFFAEFSKRHSPVKKHALPTLYDIVYNPLETPFLRYGKRYSFPILDGLDFFIAQGLEQFRLWTGNNLPAQEIRILLSAHLAQ